ncbi:uncharacterized protein Z520_08195 [Fonsecaea multimorphosa CBS 102226]|uniref:N-acetyltransferase domain-containing protein n=1 Tax=Fonsecaea multimorphosa CBS 102226 TaxID=1442371 RepID=A0A0D2H290_9EURO|nr:uncharacterized protein Z520_08195 [Fonsecaea multimorphosa CBS 102226]KIX95940.1 hypothetical protein Z520_08195 [Fonsecaea multimorphosa CBS 102226]OAL21711.1 hypothetical protein AYO22_07653 [Fonsecaea multimorphosa]
MATVNLDHTAATVNEEEDLLKFAHVIAAAFSNDALNRYLFLGRESHPDHPKLAHFDNRVQYWLPHIRSRFENGGILIQTFDYAGVALWLPPGVEKPVTSSAATSEGAAEYRRKFDALKKKYMGERTYWYLNLIARSPARLEKAGAVRNLVDPFLKKAREQNVPVWLEATNQHAREVYTHLGFKTVEYVRIGEGIVNAEGWAQPDGEGVLTYGMVAGL